MKITLPLPPNMANSRMHWRVKQKEKKAYFAACDLVSLTWKGEPDAPWKAVITPTLYCGGRMDMDNAFARCKWPVDWMVRSGYLVNDNPAHLEWEMPRQVVSRKQPYRVEFDIRRAA